MPTDMPGAVLRLSEVDAAELLQLLAPYGLQLRRGADGTAIPGSYWGDEEAGLRANRLYARADTPLHSILHEASHYICMSAARRRHLDTDAGSDDAEENAVCYLQILLAGQLGCMGRERMFSDMDAWGYSFRLGTSRAWFEADAEDARLWLLRHGLVDRQLRPTGKLRDSELTAA